MHFTKKISIINLPFILALTIIILISPGLVQAQFPEKENEETYEKEWAFGVLMNSYGGLLGGVSVRHARKYLSNKSFSVPVGGSSSKIRKTKVKQALLKNPNHYHSFSLDVVNIKHPKEQSYQSSYSGNSFVPQKRNYLVSVRPQYGREIILFRKAREQGVQVTWITNAGPALGLKIPYLIRFREDTRVKVEQYDKEKHGQNFDQIEGTGSFFEALGQTKFTVGLALKTSLAFEFGVSKHNISGVEAGLMSDLFIQEVEIMQGAQNRAFYPSLYLNFFFGTRK
ncbi:hypothetical protein [Algivirga pacifica]|uniref:Outer membrane protein beta-barrel domain-containing protein n=1 Tax=Algivirga pacifica TaxID=1162670 RepID=A0ABP9DI28_9BACT